MTAFFVSKETIDDVVSVLVPSGNKEAANTKGCLLWAMNAEALRQRYNIEGTDQHEEYLNAAINYQYERPDSSEVQKLKSIECLMYQCSEGDVPEIHPLFPVLQQSADHLRAKLDTGQRKYDPWLKKDVPVIEGYDQAEWCR